MKIRPSPEEKIAFPHTITERGVSVRIYRSENNGHPSFFVTWQDAGGRQRKRCATWDKAKGRNHVSQYCDPVYSHITIFTNVKRRRRNLPTDHLN